MTECLWRIVAWCVSRPRIASWIIRRAQRTPYFHLPEYMNRWWLFNGYAPEGEGEAAGDRESTKRFPRLPSIRVHHILREDLADHPHDHPWNARTIILRGQYLERRHDSIGPLGLRRRRPGDTAPVRFGEFHHIEQVSIGGVYTLFIVGNYIDDWGFLVDGVKVPHDEYIAAHPERG